jgi:soluble lytic murein transglycosylase-like protein
MRRGFHLIGTLLLCVGPACAGEIAMLQNGFQLHIERHEVAGSSVRLYSQSGMTELPIASVAAYETEIAPPVAAEPAHSAPALVPGPDKPATLAPKELTRFAAKREGIPAQFIESVMATESAYRANALSPKGAIGLMQLMPGTARTLGADPHDPQQNVSAGARYLRELLTRYEKEPDQVLRALAAYNAGPGAVDRYKGIPPYPETVAYVRRVLKTYERLQKKP